MWQPVGLEVVAQKRILIGGLPVAILAAVQ
jgi:hypothetical protein